MRFGDKTVVVTGAGGFIGSALVERLVLDGARVRALLRYTSRGQRGCLDDLPSDVIDSIEVSSGDVRDMDGVRAVLRDADAVFHLAALVGIPYSYEHPQDVIDTNVMGTANVLLAAKELATLERIILTSTSEVYGSAVRVPMDEQHPLQAQSPYSASKIAADALGISFHRSFGLPISVVRPFNAYGPRQSARAVIPTIISQALVGSELKLGTTETRRDFTFVDDTARGFVAVASSDATQGEVVNIGSGTDVSIAEIIAKVEVIVGRSLTVSEEARRIRPEKSEVSRLHADSSRARRARGMAARGVARRWAPSHHGLDRRTPRGVPATRVRRMKTVLLAGGRGVRLRPLTYSVPKPLLPVGERPILEEIVERLKVFGLCDIVMAVGYRAELIETYFRDGSQLGVRIEYARESEPLGTAGPLGLVRAGIGAAEPASDSVLVMNGDLLTDLDMRVLIDADERAGNDLTMVTRDFQLRHPYGVVQLEDDRITGIVEKPAVTDTVNAGIYVFKWSTLDMIEPGSPYEIPDLVNVVAASGRRVGAFPFDGRWLAIDGLEQLEDAMRMFGLPDA